MPAGSSVLCYHTSVWQRTYRCLGFRQKVQSPHLQSLVLIISRSYQFIPFSASMLQVPAGRRVFTQVADSPCASEKQDKKTFKIDTFLNRQQSKQSKVCRPQQALMR